MNERQKPIAEWMQDVIKRRKISARAWALKAKLGKDTVSRAIRDDYPHVTSTTTIAKLADAVGEQPIGQAAAIPSVLSLAEILEVLLPTVAPGQEMSRDLVLLFASALRDTLLHLADEPEALGDPRLTAALTRATVRQLNLSRA